MFCCGVRANKTTQYRGIKVYVCTHCGRLSDLFVELDLEITEVDEGGNNLIDALLPEWVEGEWADLSNLGLKHAFTMVDHPTTDRELVSLLRFFESAMDYPWVARVTYIGSGAKYRYEGPKKKSTIHSENR